MSYDDITVNLKECPEYKNQRCCPIFRQSSRENKKLCEKTVIQPYTAKYFCFVLIKDAKNEQPSTT